jgi:hypothetical protein
MCKELELNGHFFCSPCRCSIACDGAGWLLAAHADAQLLVMVRVGCANAHHHKK